MLIGKEWGIAPHFYFDDNAPLPPCHFDEYGLGEVWG